MDHAVHKVIKRMGGQTSKTHGTCGTHTFMIAKNAPNHHENIHQRYQGSIDILPMYKTPKFEAEDTFTSVSSD